MKKSVAESPFLELTRRRLLQFSGGAFGLHLGGLLRTRTVATEVRKTGPSAKIKSCILVFYYGGPSHLDTYDLKPEAPSEVRGEFKPIATTVPGSQICEHLPRMAKCMHKVALIRSVTHRNRLHDSASIEALTGRPSPQGDREEFAPIKQVFPSYGSTLHYLRRESGERDPYVALPFVFHNVVDVPCQGGGFLGSAYDPLSVHVDASSRSYGIGALNLPAEVTLERIEGRKRLLNDLIQGSAFKNESAAHEFGRYYDRSFELLSKSSISHALNLSREPNRVRERYGFGGARLKVGEGGGGGNGAELGEAREMRGQNLLIARRLVEAGVPFVNVYDFRQQGHNWDAHFKVFNQHRTHLLPLADQSLSALIEDLDDRGLLDSTLVVAMGEFGRTPKVNKEGGRDHWPDCYSILMAGGGVKGGYIHGSSDRIGAYPDKDPVTPADIAATIFWRFGIDPATEIHDQGGRPWKVSDGTPISALFV